jgi:hypothetical protein
MFLHLKSHRHNVIPSATSLELQKRLTLNILHTSKIHLFLLKTFCYLRYSHIDRSLCNRRNDFISAHRRRGELDRSAPDYLHLLALGKDPRPVDKRMDMRTN